MHLSGTGTFAPVADVVFVAVARGIGNCELIANDVRRGPLARSLAFPYHPHVTVAHDVPGDMLDFAYSGLADLSAEFAVDGVHRVRADRRRGLGGRPRVRPDRPAPLNEDRGRRAPRRATPQTRTVSSAAPDADPEPGRDPWFTRVYTWGEAVIAAQRRRRPWFDHLARAGGRYQRVHGDLLAAGVTYYAFLGLFPVLLLAASVVGLILAGDALLQQELFDAILETFPGSLGRSSSTS